MQNNTILDICDFTLDFSINNKNHHAVSGINLSINKGEIVALVGESGCGKSITAKSVMGLNPKTSIINSGKILINNTNVLDYDLKQWQKVRGKDVSMIFQEPMTALNPLIKVGKQIQENLTNHNTLSKPEAKQAVLNMLKLVGLSDSERIYNSYPHQLSGGMRQRIMIACALINNPSLLIADEPTTALDVTIQAQIMDLIKKLNEKTDTAVLLISHDLGVIRNICHKVYVMYAGKIVESGLVDEVFQNPTHPYTKGLINSIPSINKKNSALETIPGMVEPIANRDYTKCTFLNRCALKDDECNNTLSMTNITDTHCVLCAKYNKGI